MTEQQASQQQMGNRPVKDNVPWLRAAGKPGKPVHGGLFEELKVIDAPPTPKHVAPYRKSYYARVGCPGRHHGLRNDPLPPDVRFGRQGEYGLTAEQCLRPADSSKGLEAVSAEAAERCYLSHKREPLGKCPMMSCELPSKCKIENFAYGMPTNTSENSKNVIYNCAEKHSEDVIRPPGKQKDRNYNWAGVNIDPTKFRFGCSTAGDSVTTKELFTPPTHSTILPRIVEQHNNTKPIGLLEKGRNFGFGGRPQGYDHVYGKFYGKDEMGARFLLSGGGISSASQQTTYDDETIGRPVCKSAILRNLRKRDAKTVDPNRSFGCPTVRTDLKKPKNRKVTEGNNYGDDPNAMALLYPSPYTASGVTEDVFLQPQTYDQIKTLISKVPDFGLNEKEMEKAFALACRRAGLPKEGGKVSLNDFREAADAIEQQ